MLGIRWWEIFGYFLWKYDVVYKIWSKDLGIEGVFIVKEFSIEGS